MTKAWTYFFSKSWVKAGFLSCGSASQVGIEADRSGACCSQVHFGWRIWVVCWEVHIKQEAPSRVRRSIWTCNQPTTHFEQPTKALRQSPNQGKFQMKCLLSHWVGLLRSRSTFSDVVAQTADWLWACINDTFPVGTAYVWPRPPAPQRLQRCTQAFAVVGSRHSWPCSCR